MPEINLTIDESRLVARFDKIGPDVHQALVAALNRLAGQIAANARGLAAAHIRYLGKKPGQYLASIYGGVSENTGSVVGFVRSGNPLAHLLEGGATIPAHDIFAKAGDALAFYGDAGTVFAKVVHSPGAIVPPYPAIEPAFTSARDEIERTVKDTVSGVLNK